MSIPKRFKLDNSYINVYKQDYITNSSGEFLLGKCSSYQRTILIARLYNLTNVTHEDEQFTTFFHELFHMIILLSGTNHIFDRIPEFKMEDFVNHLSIGYVNVHEQISNAIRDNKRLTSLTYKGIVYTIKFNSEDYPDNVLYDSATINISDYYDNPIWWNRLLRLIANMIIDDCYDRIRSIELNNYISKTFGDYLYQFEISKEYE